MEKINDIIQKNKNKEMEVAKKNIAAEYMKLMEKELGHKNYIFWNGLETGFELCFKWMEAQN